MVVDKAFADDDHQGSETLLSDLPNTVHHQVLNTQMFGKRNIDDGCYHKQSKPGNASTNQTSQHHIADLSHQRRFKQGIDSGGK